MHTKQLSNNVETSSFFEETAISSSFVGTLSLFLRTSISFVDFLFLRGDIHLLRGECDRFLEDLERFFGDAECFYGESERSLSNDATLLRGELGRPRGNLKRSRGDLASLGGYVGLLGRKRRLVLFQDSFGGEDGRGVRYG